MMEGTTRRALFTTAAAATLIAAAPAAAMGGDTRWDRSFTAWQTATRRAQASGLDDDWEAEGEAWRAIIDMPAPHGRALAWKIEYLLEAGRDGYSSAWSADVVDPVIADARRLLGGAA